MFIISSPNRSFVVVAVENGLPQLTNDESLYMTFETHEEATEVLGIILDPGYSIIEV